MFSKIHFFHANGFPVETYNELLKNLEGQVLPPIRIIGEALQTVDEGYDNFVDEVIEHAFKTKGEGVAIGHSLGATGVQEAIYCILMMKNNFLSGSANIQNLDEKAANHNIITESLNKNNIVNVMSNSFGFGGTNATLIFSKT